MSRFAVNSTFGVSTEGSPNQKPFFGSRTEDAGDHDRDGTLLELREVTDVGLLAVGLQDKPVADLQLQLVCGRLRERDLEERHLGRACPLGDVRGDGAYPCARRAWQPAGDHAELRLHPRRRHAEVQIAHEALVRRLDVGRRAHDEGPLDREVVERGGERLVLGPLRAPSDLRERVGGGARGNAARFEQPGVASSDRGVREGRAETVVGERVEQAGERREQEAGRTDQDEHRQRRPRVEPDAAEDQAQARPERHQPSSAAPRLGSGPDDAHGAGTPSPARSTGASLSRRITSTWTIAITTSAASRTSSTTSSVVQGTTSRTGGIGAAPDVPEPDERKHEPGDDEAEHPAADEAGDDDEGRLEPDQAGQLASPEPERAEHRELDHARARLGRRVRANPAAAKIAATAKPSASAPITPSATGSSSSARSRLCPRDDGDAPERGGAQALGDAPVVGRLEPPFGGLGRLSVANDEAR